MLSGPGALLGAIENRAFLTSSREMVWRGSNYLPR
jgi:hypothetical protein